MANKADKADKEVKKGKNGMDEVKEGGKKSAYKVKLAFGQGSIRHEKGETLNLTVEEATRVAKYVERKGASSEDE